ncbi:hypothetical protein AOL_s00076g405 [Orbilia oligospora ATCC 24927]|uniref:tyrosine--tRNA ligase n=1 Tax=Arthrobotrys oligospora (strain ATCC 24927 / CBS 115.81 / DSM 1491) TaxID=756982 RepID=G1X9R6_ARTOA|nr:hypothetical protein AOL_s00076g405 [Orbilia oligospora ATCC 24927]EGX50054.1 hypothetical protein AOL_s00076g405 [Orbilia oligospora ATCC 24927]
MAETKLPGSTDSQDHRLDLILRGLERVDTADAELIKDVLHEKVHPDIFWGVAPTGRPHIGYLVPFVKIAELVEAGVEVKILLADLYAFLVNYRHSRSLVASRREYYRFALTAVFETISGLPASTIAFHQETSFSVSPDFINDVYELLSYTSLGEARSPNEELATTTMLSPLVVPIVQALDERYMDCDFQLGGLDQAGYYVYGDKYLPKIGHKKRHAHIMNKMLPGLTGTKMSASNPKSKIDLLDPPEIVYQKIMEAHCDSSTANDNPILALLKIILVPIGRLRLEQSARAGSNAKKTIPFVEPNAPEGCVFSIMSGRESYHYKSYEAIEHDFLAGKLSSGTLKAAVADAMNQILAPIRKSYEDNSQWQDVLKIAYPESERDVSNASPETQNASENFCIPTVLREVSNERVKLIPFNPALHTAEFIKRVQDSPEVWTHGPVGPFESAENFDTDFIDKIVRPKTDMLLYAVIDRCKPPTLADKDGALAGLIAYLGTSPANLCTEIGFVVTLPQFQRTHVTSNAVGLLLKLALDSPNEGGLGFRRVQWMTSSVNHPSIKTAEKMGFTKEGVIRWDRLYPGGANTGKESNGKPLDVDGKVGHMNGRDLGRDSVMFSMCWDDWYLSGMREHVNERMAR